MSKLLLSFRIITDRLHDVEISVGAIPSAAGLLVLLITKDSSLSHSKFGVVVLLQKECGTSLMPLCDTQESAHTSQH